MPNYFYGPQAEQFAFYRISKALFTDPAYRGISPDAKVLYGLLLDRMSLSARNDWLDKLGRVYIVFTVEEVMAALCCADNKATRLLRELEGVGLIERKRRGLGKPSLIYVKNFAEVPEQRIKNRENHDSVPAQTATLEAPKSRSNKTDKNNTDLSETDPFPSGGGGGIAPAPGIRNIFSGSSRSTLLLQAAPTMKICCAKYWSCWWTLCAANAGSSALQAMTSPLRW